jgi:hypothetical protein
MKQLVANTDPQDLVIDRLIRDGEVAVLYSPGYGAGWSTWCHEDLSVRLSMVFDPQIADIVDQRGPDWREKAEAIALVKYPEAYIGGLSDLQVKWVPRGTQFRVLEYDGSESVEINGEIEWITA